LFLTPWHFFTKDNFFLLYRVQMLNLVAPLKLERYARSLSDKNRCLWLIPLGSNATAVCRILHLQVCRLVVQKSI